MTEIILRLFVKDSENVSNIAVRTRYGIVAGIVGIVCNTLLAIAKFLFGVMSSSVAVTADAVNNLSDSATSILTLVGFKLSSKPADRDHPFGHGRIEYICAFVVSFFVLLVGFEVAKTSFVRIIRGESAEFSIIVAIGLAVSIFIKLWLSHFNKKLGRKISSSAMTAVAADSLSDALSTAVTLVSIIAAKFTKLPIDGFVGILVSILIFKSGIGILKDTLTPLLGKAPDADLVKRVQDEVEAYEKIYGVHDIIIHEYGPGKIFASLHAEVSSTENILESHALIDKIENEVSKKLGVEILIHMDPLEVENEEVSSIRDKVCVELQKLDKSFSIHDFRIVTSGDFKNILFDVIVPIDYPAPDSIVKDMIKTSVGAIDATFVVKPKIDRSVVD